jgi:hypothetical protein
MRLLPSPTANGSEKAIERPERDSKWNAALRQSLCSVMAASATLLAASLTAALGDDEQARPPVEFSKQVDSAILRGARYLKTCQRDDGSWPDVVHDARTGMTSLVTLALLSAGEKVDSPAIQKALAHLRRFGPDELRSTYAVSLQTMAFAVADPETDERCIAANVIWLEKAQIQPGDPFPWHGSWSYGLDAKRHRPGDASNTQYALLALRAASDTGIPVQPVVWARALDFWKQGQKPDGSWAYTPDTRASSASMTCAGISSLMNLGWGKELLEGESIRDCGKNLVMRNVQAGMGWLASHFRVDENFGSGRQWRFYYLYGLERAIHLAGVRFLGNRDCFRLAAESLIGEQDKRSGAWRGVFQEEERALATSFALLFLSKGRAPVLISKLRHGPSSDWHDDPNDVSNIVAIVSRDWNKDLNWQIVDPDVGPANALQQAPILFLNGHYAPELTVGAKRKLREFVEQGGFVLVDACCGSPEFDEGFKALMKEIFPEQGQTLQPLSEEHPIWTAKHKLHPDAYPLLGIRRGTKTVVVYSPKDLSCYWNLARQNLANPAVLRAIKLGQNVIEYATGGKLPPE